MAGFIPHDQRNLRLTMSIDFGDLETMPDRLMAAFHRHLIVRIGEVGDKIIDHAKAQLVPGHGYDTGLMHDTLDKFLQDLADAVLYNLESHEAEYWKYVEFGHMTRSGRWWQGYHFLENAVVAHERALQEAVQQAWRDAVREVGGSSPGSPVLTGGQTVLGYG